MVYKVEVSSTQYFPNGEFLNFTEEKHFWKNEYYPLNDRKDAFDYLLSFKHESGIERHITLGYIASSYVFEELCIVRLFALEEYENEQEAKDEYELEFNIDNLHNEHTAYLDEEFQTGGPSLKLTDYPIYKHDEDNLGDFLEVSAEILAVNKSFLSLNSILA